MHDCYPCTWLLPECCIIFLWTELENSNLSDSKTGRSNSAVWKGFSICWGWGFLGCCFCFVGFFFRKTQQHQRWQNPFIWKEKALHTIWTAWKGSRGYCGIIVRLWNHLKCLNGLWREKINLVQRGKKVWGRKWSTHDQPHVMFQPLLRQCYDRRTANQSRVTGAYWCHCWQK